MHKHTALMPCWKGAELLSVSIPSVLESFSEDSKLVVILNEVDKESINVCIDNKVEFIGLNRNHGTLAVDYASSLVNSEYVSNVNSDMLFVKGWDSNLIDIINQYGPCSASCFLVEPYNGVHPNPTVIADNIGEFTNPLTKTIFLNNYKEGKYKLNKKRRGFNHPIMVKTNDYFDVGGYSNNFDQRYYPGYSLDYNFPWRLWTKYGGKFDFIVSDTSCVYHGVSLTNNKLEPDIKARNGWNAFIQDAGMDTATWNRWIRALEEID